MQGISELHEHGIVRGEHTLKVNFVFSSDWKFLALLMGIKNANSKYFCPWCCCSKDVRNDIQIDWSCEIYKRNWKENHSSCHECKDAPKPCTRTNHGYNPDTNLLKFPFAQSNEVLETLHAVLRTSEFLEKELKNRAQTKLQQMAINSSKDFFQRSLTILMNSRHIATHHRGRQKDKEDYRDTPQRGCCVA